MAAPALEKHVSDRMWEVCYSRLNLDEKTVEEGTRLLEMIVSKKLKTEEADPENVWIACALFIASINQSNPAVAGGTEVVGNGVKLSQLLKATDVYMVQFLDYVTMVISKLKLAASMLDKVKMLKESFVVASLLFKKYEALWHKREKLWDFPSRSSLPSDPSVLDQLYRFGWQLFISCKGEIQMGTNDIGTSYPILIACLSFLLINAPRTQRAVEAEVAATLSALGAGTGSTATAGGSAAGGLSLSQSGHDIDTLALNAICRAAGVSTDVVGSSLASLMKCMARLKAEGGLMGAPVSDGLEGVDHLAPEGLQKVLSNKKLSVVRKSRAFQGLLCTPFLSQNIHRLSEAYELQYLYTMANLDERIFLASDASNKVGTPSKLSSAARPVPVTPTRADRKLFQNGDAAPPESPMKRSAGSGAAAAGITAAKSAASSMVAGKSKLPPRSPMRPYPSTPKREYLRSTARSPLLQTPVSAAVDTQTWIRTVVAKSPSTPSATLLEYFNICGPNVAQNIQDRVQKLVDRLSSANSGLSRSRRELLFNDEGKSSPQSSNRVAQTNDGPKSTAEGQSKGQDSFDTAEKAGENLPTSSVSLTAPLPSRRVKSEVESGILRTRQLGVALYYRVIETLLRAEEGRLKTKNFSSLLTNDLFHRSMLACSMEVILKAHSLVTLAFPKLLDVFDLSGFDLVKSIESFVRCAPELPAFLKRHMQEVEDQILESRAWSSDSPLYQLLREQARNLDGSPQPAASREQAKRPTSTETGNESKDTRRSDSPQKTSGERAIGKENEKNAKEGKASATLAATSDFRDKTDFESKGKDSTANAAAPKDTRDHKGLEKANESDGLGAEARQEEEGTKADKEVSQNRPSKSKSAAILEVFFRKVVSLAGNRVFAYCRALELQRPIVDQVWTVVRHCMSDAIDLFRDRHLDQIILCSIYGVCKVNRVEPDVKFRRVIEIYRRQQPHNTQRMEVIRNVLLQPGVAPTADALSSATPSWSSSSSAASTFSSDPSRTSNLHSSGVSTETRGDVIKFYNKVFVPRIKTFLLQFQQHQAQKKAMERLGVDEDTAIATGPPSVVETAASTLHSALSSFRADLRDQSKCGSARSRGLTSMSATFGESQGRSSSTSAHSPPPVSSSSIVSALPCLSRGGAAHRDGLVAPQVETIPAPLYQSSPKRVLGSNVYLSPRRPSSVSSPVRMTPRTRALYAFGESPARDLALINRAVNRKRPAPVLSFDEDGGKKGAKRGKNEGMEASRLREAMAKRHAILDQANIAKK